MIDPYKPIESNQALNQKPKAGGLSNDVFAPVLAVLGICIGAWAFGAPISWCIGIFLWLSAGWLIFAGNNPHIHLAKLFKKVPNLFTARINYEPREDIPLRKRNDHY